MSYIRFRKHYIHIPHLVLGILEFVVLFAVFSLLTLILSLVGVNHAPFHTDILSAFLFALVREVSLLFFSEPWLPTVL